MNRLLITTQNRTITSFNGSLGNVSRLEGTSIGNPLMLLSVEDDYIVGCGGTLLKYNKDFTIKMSKRFNQNTHFHRGMLYSGHLYLTATGLNEIWVTDLNFNKKFTHYVDPITSKEHSDLNHVNNIFYQDGRHYVLLNRMNIKQFYHSGIIVYDETFGEIFRFPFSWQAHNFCIIDGDMYALAASNHMIREVHHPKRAGLIKNGYLVWEHDPKFFCKAFDFDTENFYIVGGDISVRDTRQDVDGILYIVDRKTYRLKDQYIFSKAGAFCGCLLEK